MEKLIYERLEVKSSSITFDLLKEKIETTKLPNFQIISNSMSPFLKIGDEVLLKNITPEDLRIGDIIVYQMNGHLFSHRYINIIKKEGRILGLIFKGDNSLDFDGYLVFNNKLLGKVIAIKRENRLINLSHFPWRKINLLIGILSFSQGSVIKFCRYFKHKLLKKNLSPYFKRIIGISFSIFIKSITISAYIFLNLFNKFTRSCPKYAQPARQ